MSTSAPWSMRVIKSLIFLLVLDVATCLKSSWIQLPLRDNAVNSPILTISRQWQSLGPFRIGTREAIWGADPLEAYGSFNALPYDQHATFRSPLTTNATVHWTTHDFDVNSTSQDTVAVQLCVEFPDVDWAFLQRIYGWSALQFQAWTRGEIQNYASTSQRVLIYPDGILEFRLNGIHVFGGDFYSFSRAPVVVDLEPGKNLVEIRLIRDVRAMGGQLPPVVEAQFRVQLIEEAVYVDEQHMIVPDLVDNMLPSLHMSVPLLNALSEWICVRECHQELAIGHAQLMKKTPMCLAPGQTRSIAMEIHESLTDDTISSNICYHIGYPDVQDYRNPLQSVSFSRRLQRRNTDEAHKFTFLHPSGAVSYAIIKAPSSLPATGSIPLLVNLHGAGLEADSHQVRHVLDEITDLQAFSLFPTGMSPWSGDDWHVWGMADVLAAIDAVHDWAQKMQWTGPVIDTRRVLMSGHSNGGQGTWFFASHMPDRTLAAVPASGYTSIENYVPFNLWHESDPLQSAVLHTARAAFKHELLLENLLHIPILQQHGSDDDNVPPYHSRLMSSLRAELGANSDYIEIAGKEHWWDGAMTTKPLQDFYKKHLSSGNKPAEIPSYFTLVSTATDEMGSKFGIKIEQLLSPDRLARVEVRITPQGRSNEWQITTNNVLGLRFDFTSEHITAPDYIVLDKSKQCLTIQEHQSVYQFIQTSKDMWIQEDPEDSVRTGAARGTLDAIMRTKHAFSIVSCGEDLEIALQISRNMLQYFGADSNILFCGEYEYAKLQPGNMILIETGVDLPSPKFPGDYPITFGVEDIKFRLSTGSERSVPYHQGLGGVFLRPLSGERLELLVWGYDMEGLKQAARLVPTLSGGGQPDFVLLGRKAKRTGHEGALALGFLDYRWQISRGSYLP